MSSQITSAHFQQVKTNFRTLALTSDENSQPTLFKKIAAKTNNALVKNKLRNNIGQIVHGNATEKNESYHFLSSQMKKSRILSPAQKAMIQKLSSHRKYGPLFHSFQTFCQKVLSHKKNQAADLNEASHEFFNSLLKQIPKDLQEKASACLKDMTESSGHLINAVSLDGEKIQKFMKVYFNTIETVVEMLFQGDDKSDNDIKEFKNILLCTSVVSGFFLTYEKRSLANKMQIGVKQSLFSLAYVFGAVSSVALSVTLSPILSPVALFFVGSLVGFALAKSLEYCAEKSLESAEKDIEKHLHGQGARQNNEPTIDMRHVGKIVNENKSSPQKLNHKINIALEGNVNHELEGKTLNIEKDMEEIKNLMKLFDGKNPQPQVAQKVKELFYRLSPEKEMVQELFGVLHEGMNKGQLMSSKDRIEFKKRWLTIMNTILPKSLTHEQKFFLMSSSLLALNLRNYDVAFLRKSDSFLFFLFDSLTDAVGIATTSLLQPLFHTLPELSKFALDFGGNLMTGLIPAGIGVLVYFALTAHSAAKDKKGIHLPNENVLEEVLAYKTRQVIQVENTLAMAHKLKLQGTLDEYLKSESSKNNGKFLTFRWNNKVKNNCELNFVNSHKDMQDGFLLYPLVDNNLDDLSKLENKLSQEIFDISKKRSLLKAKAEKLEMKQTKKTKKSFFSFSWA